MDEFELEPKISLIESKPELIPILREIEQVGFSKDVYQRAEEIEPGIFKDIDPKQLTAHHSSVKRLVAMEAFDMDEHSRGLVTGGLGIAAAGALAFGIYKLYKWFMGIIQKDEPQEISSDDIRAAEGADAALDRAGERAERENKPDRTIKPKKDSNGFMISEYLQGKPGKIQVIVRQIYNNIGKSMSDTNAKKLVDTLLKSSVVSQNPLAAISFSYQGGVPAIIGAVKSHGLSPEMMNEIVVYSDAYYKAAVAMFDYSMTPDSSNMDKLKAAITGLRKDGALKPNLGKLLDAMESGKLPPGNLRVCWKTDTGAIPPDSDKAKPVIEFIGNGGVQNYVSNLYPALKHVLDLTDHYKDAAGNVSEKLDPKKAKIASEKIRDEKIATDVREIHKGLTRAVKLRHLCSQVHKSMSLVISSDVAVTAAMNKYTGNK